MSGIWTCSIPVHFLSARLNIAPWRLISQLFLGQAILQKTPGFSAIDPHWILQQEVLYKTTCPCLPVWYLAESCSMHCKFNGLFTWNFTKYKRCIKISMQTYKWGFKDFKFEAILYKNGICVYWPPHPTHTSIIFIIHGTLWNVFLFNYGFTILTHYLSEIVMVSHIL